MAWWWIGIAVAVEGFESVRTAHNCAISMRPEAHPDGAAMRADCRWPDVQLTTMTAGLGDYTRYTEYVFPIVVSRVERLDDAGRSLVYQRQHIFGIADREVLLWMRQGPVEGGVRFSWSAAVEEPLSLGDGNVRVVRNEGYWEVVADDAGGVRVVHQVAMDAGGSIPKWLVQLVRTRSFARIMGDVRRVLGPEAGR